MKLIPCLLVTALVAWVGVVRDAEAVHLTRGDVVATLTSQERIVKINPDTGDRTTISCTDTGTPQCPIEVATGPELRTATVVTISPDGSILVAADLGAPHYNALIRIDPATGDRTIVSSVRIAHLGRSQRTDRSNQALRSP